MSLPRYSFCGRFKGQPTIPGIGNCRNVVMAGLNEQAVATPQSPGTWTIADSVRDNYATSMVAVGDTHAILDQEDSLDTAKLVKVQTAFNAFGIDSTWFAPVLPDDGAAGIFRETDPARYAAWLAARRAIHLPYRMGAAFGAWPWKPGQPDGDWIATVLEQAYAYRAQFPNAMVVPVAWYRYEAGQAPVPLHLFRSQLRIAVAVCGRVVLTVFPPDSDATWATALHDPFVQIFLQEAGRADLLPVPAAGVAAT